MSPIKDINNSEQYNTTFKSSSHLPKEPEKTHSDQNPSLDTAKKLNEMSVGIKSGIKAAPELSEGIRETITADSANQAMSGLSSLRNQATRVVVGAKAVTIGSAAGSSTATIAAGVGAAAGSVALTAGIGMAIIGTGVLIGKAFEKYIDHVLVTAPTEEEIQTDLDLTAALFPHVPKQSLEERRIEVTVNNIEKNSLHKGTKLSEKDLEQIKIIVTNKLYPNGIEGVRPTKLSHTLKPHTKTVSVLPSDAQVAEEIVTKLSEDSAKVAKDVEKTLTDNVSKSVKINTEVASKVTHVAHEFVRGEAIVSGTTDTVKGLTDMMKAESPTQLASGIKTLGSGTQALGREVRTLSTSVDNTSGEMLKALSGVSAEIATIATVGSTILGTLAITYEACQKLVDNTITQAPSLKEVETYLNLQDALYPHLPRPSVKETRIQMTVDSIQMNSQFKGINLSEADLKKIREIVTKKLYPEESPPSARPSEARTTVVAPALSRPTSIPLKATVLSSKASILEEGVVAVGSKTADTVEKIDDVFVDDLKKMHTMNAAVAARVSATVHPLATESSILTGVKETALAARSLVNAESGDKAAASLEKIGIGTINISEGIKSLGTESTPGELLGNLSPITAASAEVTLIASSILGAVVSTYKAYEKYIENMTTQPPTEREVQIDLDLTAALYPKLPRKTLEERRIEMTVNNIEFSNNMKGIKLSPTDLEKIKLVITEKLYPKGPPSRRTSEPTPSTKASPAIIKQSPLKRRTVKEYVPRDRY